MSVREKIIPPPNVNREEIIDFSRSVNVPPIVGNLLWERGVDTFEKAKAYFRPGLDELHDPFLLTGMREAVQRIRRAIEEKEMVAVYGDYDVDGITGSALLYHALKSAGIVVKTYLPNRLEEGYGLSRAGIKEIRSAGVSLIVTVDCGITAVEEVEIAREAGMDVIVTDHHEPGEKLPKAFALLNPKLEDSVYPEKSLAGVGVAFKLVQGLYRALELPDEQAFEYLDLVALGSAADIVPLMGENRVLVKAGFEKMRNTSNFGIAELIRVNGLYGKDINTGHVVFGMAPMINAVGRLGKPDRGFHLLISESQVQASNIIQILRSDNEKRKEVDRRVTEEAVAIVKETIDLDQTYGIVLASREWHSGVIGIVASRLVENFYRPSILIAIDKGGVGKGSARTIQDFHIFNALSECGGLLEKFGGHACAAGITIREDQVEPFREEFNRICKKNLEGKHLAPEVRPCGRLRLGDVDARFMRLLKLMEPFGPGNARPVFYSDELRLVGKPYKVGDSHLKFSVTQDAVVLDAIGFGMSDRKDLLDQSFNNFGLAFGLEENSWKNNTKIQLKVKGIDL